MTFEELKITRQYLNALEDLGFSAPTPVQEKAIPPIKGGQDVIAVAQTGTGKTAAYLLPLMQVLVHAQGSDARCLILVPSKELVLQVAEQARALAKYTDFRFAALYGGIGHKAQAAELAEGVDFIISTPGRFMEIYLKENFPVKKIKHVVLDEADRMLDYGFFPQLRALQEVLPQKKQSILLSATFPERIQNLVDGFMLYPIKIEIAPSATAADNIRQVVYMADNFQTKLHLLLHLLDNDPMDRVMVFVKTKEAAENIYRFLLRKLVGTVRVIHANKGQNTRINAMNDFKEGGVRVLVATDVASRGIDAQDVTHVVNFSVPRNYEDYVHRIGRTGRIFKTGTAITFCDPAEKFHVSKIEELIRMPIEVLPLPAIPKTKTPKDEWLEQLKEIDLRRQKEDPNYKGAFHKKKHVIVAEKQAAAQKKRNKKLGPTGIKPSASKKK